MKATLWQKKCSAFMAGMCVPAVVGNVASNNAFWAVLSIAVLLGNLWAASSDD